MKLKIYTAIVHHRHGFNSFAAASKADLTAQLADYCRGEWEAEMPDDLTAPEDDDEWVEDYFDSESPHGETVAYDDVVVDLSTHPIGQLLGKVAAMNPFAPTAESAIEIRDEAKALIQHPV